MSRPAGRATIPVEVWAQGEATRGLQGTSSGAREFVCQMGEGASRPPAALDQQSSTQRRWPMKATRILPLLVLVLTATTPALADDGVFEFGRFRGIPTAGLNVRNIPGGGLPWTIRNGEAELGQDGTLKVEVEGLVLAAGPNVGTNPIPAFMATLSCLNADGTINNIDTPPVPATSTGDARIEQVLTLPDTCLGPIVFIRAGLPTNSRWFAISGF